MIPYFLCFLWVDDKRRTYFKDERIYPAENFSPPKDKQNEDMVFERAEETSADKRDREKQLALKKLESKVLREYDDTKDNKRISIISMGNVFKKTGHYILNMGAVSQTIPYSFILLKVNFFEYLIINLMLLIFVDRRQ